MALSQKICLPLILLFLASNLLDVTESTKILFFIGFASHSHRVSFQALATALADRGHNVTFYSAIKPEVEDPRIQEFCTKRTQEWNDLNQKEISSLTAMRRFEDRHFDPIWEGTLLFDMFLDFNQNLLTDPEFLGWAEAAKFDLVIYDAMGKEFLFPWALKMGAKVIAHLPYPMPAWSDYDLWNLPMEPWLNDYVTSPCPLRFVPDRWYSYFMYAKWLVNYRGYFLPKLEAITREAFTFEFPPLRQLMENIDLVFINNHHSLMTTKAYPPFVIPVGGMHVQDTKGILPQDLEDFIKDADEFVFISFGSIIRVSALPAHVQQRLFDAVASLKNTKFFWKWEGEIPANLPKNALAKKWFPQQEILAHKKCKGFVTQGGLMSLQQAVYHQVPMVVVPGFGDQSLNAREASDRGYAIYLELGDITKETLADAIHQIIYTDQYKRNVQEASQIFRDRPMSAVDTAVWWTEYVLRRNTSTLKSRGKDITWWERRMMDFWFFVFSSVLALATMLLLAIKLALRLLCAKSSGKIKTS